MSAAPNSAALLHGVLAHVWLAAHWERKLSKTQLVHTSVPECTEEIATFDETPAALRICGQLLLGVARIYARKAKYLQDDCNDALLRIKVAFRPAGASVDLPQDQLNLAASAITLPDAWTAWDLMMPQPTQTAWPGISRPSTAHTASIADITLPDTPAIDMHDVLELPPIDVADAQLDLGLENSYDPPLPMVAREPPQKRARRSTRGRAPLGEISQNADDSLASIGVGRDASTVVESDADRVNALLGDLDMPSFDLSTHSGLGHEAMMDDAPVFDMSNASINPIDTSFTGFNVSRSTPPREATPPRQVGFEEAIGQRKALTPRAAEKLKAAARMRTETRVTRKRAVQDAVTELSDGITGPSPAVLRELRSAHELFCLPRSRIHLALSGANGVALFGAQSSALVLVDKYSNADATAIRHAALQRDPHMPARDARERQHWLLQIRDETQRALDEFPDEVGRRASPPAQDLPDISMDPPAEFDKSADSGFDVSELPEIAMDEQPEPQPEPQLEPQQQQPHGEDPSVESASPAPLRRSMRHRDEANDDEFGHLPPLRLASPAPSEEEFTVPENNPIAAFDSRSHHDHADANARRAAQVLRTTMTSGKAQSMSKLSENASRRAAAGFFFELLVLGSRGCVRLKQDEPYGDIAITDTPRLWDDL
ncbi:sister chromatid cohesion protein 1 [Malassezia cuniculi]|uniref:Sister chromatid cohesion protein 1 n=1 Tax=Malassezia cuniculi TaxID=948313 RepID=A0AAF0EU65_9BASI|nr:sister chromatid cohesion protein 1 [Malassezia cuniculi]